MFRNERKLYRRTCDASQKSIISIYSPDSPYKVYDQKVRRSDSRDALDYGRDFDFSRSFTQQFRELQLQVPRLSVMNTSNNENSEYGCGLDYCKNCYLVTNGDQLQDCYFSTDISNSHKVFDCTSVIDSEDCYGCIDIKNCQRCHFSYNCSDSLGLQHCYDCHGCSFCYGCTNLSQQQYCINNKAYSKEEYQQKIKTAGMNDGVPIYHNINLSSEKVFGNNIINSQNCIQCFDTNLSENGKYAVVVVDGKNFMDINSGAYHSDLCYESVGAGLSLYKVGIVSMVYNSSNVWYSELCNNSEHCFGCIGLRNKQYCIFNKQYTKEEYNELVPKIIGHMMSSPLEGGQGGSERGEFFDPSLSPFGYNETVAQEYFPLTKSDLTPSPSPMRRGEGDGGIGVRSNYFTKIKWQENNYDPVVPDHVETLTGDQVPSINQIDANGESPAMSGSILQKIIVCEVSGRPFRIIRQELDFYRKHNLPLPRKHPDVRHEERLKQRPPRELHLRHCDKCGVEMVSVYQNIEISKDGNISSDSFGTSSDSSKVYCEKCYQTEIYG